MTIYRQRLPQLGSDIFLTDGGIETTLIFHDGFDLPHFAAFDLLRSEQGRAALTAYYERYLAIARADGLGFVLESPTWRASRDWGAKLGYSADDIAAVNAAAIELMRALRERHRRDAGPLVISGCVGPRGDGYDPGELMSVDQAADYHGHQIDALARAGADQITAVTMTNVEEAAGIAQAAARSEVPAVISFTVETDGRLPTGQPLAEAIRAVDEAAVEAPAYYMINCAHPTHFDQVLPADEAWVARLRGLRANASRMSHEELDEAPELDTGNPAELGEQYRELRARHPQITVLGGCCGTDHRHVSSISRACRAA